MGLEQTYIEKYITQGLSEEDARKAAKFPWLDSTIFTAEMVSVAAIKKSAEQFIKGNIDAIPEILRNELLSRTDQVGSKLDQMASDEIIRGRLKGLKLLLRSYLTLPKDPTYKYPVPQFTEAELVTQLLSENLDLLLLKDQPAERLKETLTYLYALKGYRDNRDRTPGPLTELAEKGLATLAGGSKPSGSSMAVPPSSSAFVGGGFLRCAGALGR
jgi:hypothetical protein